MTAGTILAGKYRLISLLGRGGMGSVWRAERLGWQAPVAIKLMNLTGTEDERARARFQRESRLAASLRSVHVVQVLDDGVDSATGAPFIVMELLEGETLAERLARLGRLKAPIVAQVVTQIARALARAHDAGLIHRDLKPDNVLIVRNDDEEVIKVLDFGIAKWLAAPQKLAHRTHSGHMLGTPAYMSPEQFTNAATIDHRADLWSLGVIAYECMTGVRPFEGDNVVRLALAICSTTPRAPSSLLAVPEGFDAWFERAMAKDAEDRFPSARLMAEELRGLCGQIPMLWEPSAKPPREHIPHELTELEPVLELTRRASSRAPGAGRRGRDSARPSLGARGPRARRRTRLWLGIGASLLLGSTVLALSPRLQSRSLDATSKLLQRVSELRAKPAPPPAPIPLPPDTALPPLPREPGAGAAPSGASATPDDAGQDGGREPSLGANLSLSIP